MILLANKRFQAEMKRLKRLKGVADYSFKEAREKMLSEIKSGALGIADEINLGESFKIFNLVGVLKGQASRYLRELIFVRAISALEVYLIDSIKEIADINPAFFKSDEKLEISRSKLFSSNSLSSLLMEVINKDCRGLGSGGFSEITKYYRNKLNIDYSSLHPGLRILEEYHDRRHILVHRLGKVDEKYAHKYNFIAKKLSVEDEYLMKALNDLELFSQEHSALIMNYVFEVPFQELTTFYRCACVLEGNISQNDFLKPNFTLTSGVVLENLLKVSRVNNGRIIFVLEGEKNHVREYAHLLKSGHRLGKIQLFYINPKSI